MTRTQLVAATILLTASAACESGDDGPGGGGGLGGAAPLLVQTDSGPIEGALLGTTRAFLGIPYAEPPVGPLRWKRPAPHPPWTETLRAVARGKSCAQTSALSGEFAEASNEDCLTLNVWTPERPGGAPLPVLVWFHGGGFSIGSGGDGAYDGQALSERTGAVVVTLNYRLGAFGFLGLPELAAEDASYPSTGNYGLDDQRAALTWVAQNAAAFGGDASRITIFGESAGGASVCHHLVSPQSAGLFAGAIIQSGPCDLVTTEAEAFAQGAALAEAVGCQGSGLLACLRSKTTAEIVNGLPAAMFTLAMDGTSWSPVVDGFSLPDTPSALLSAGPVTRVPTILGSNADEATLFFQLGQTTIADDAELLTLAEGLVPGRGADIVAQYPSSTYGSAQAAAVAAVTDAGFACPTRRAARSLAAAGVPAYLYHFRYGPASLFGDLGAFHSAEIKFVLGTPGQLQPLPLTEEEAAMSGEIMGYWFRLAERGDPNDEGALAWPRYDAVTDENIVLDLSLSVESGLRRVQCDFWDGIDVDL